MAFFFKRMSRRVVFDFIEEVLEDKSHIDGKEGVLLKNGFSLSIESIETNQSYILFTYNDNKKSLIFHIERGFFDFPTFYYGLGNNDFKEYKNTLQEADIDEIKCEKDFSFEEAKKTFQNEKLYFIYNEKLDKNEEDYFKYLPNMFLNLKEKKCTVKYALFCNLSSKCQYHYGIISKNEKGESFLEIFSPSIWLILDNQKISHLNNFELIRDQIYGFLIFHEIPIIVDNFHHLVANKELSRKDALLEVVLSPFQKYPYLLECSSKFKIYIRCQDDEFDFLKQKSEEYFPESLFEHFKKISDTNLANNIDLPNYSIATTIVQKSLPKTLKIYDFQNQKLIRYVDFYKHRLFYQEKIILFLKYSFLFCSKANLNQLCVYTIVDIGQVESIMGVANKLSSRLNKKSEFIFFDGFPGSVQGELINRDRKYFFLIIKSHDPNDIIANGAAIAAAFRVSTHIIIPVSMPITNALHSIDYGLSNYSKLILSDDNINLDNKKICIYTDPNIRKMEVLRGLYMLRKLLSRYSDNTNFSIYHWSQNLLENFLNPTETKVQSNAFIDGLTAFAAINDYSEYICNC